MSPTETEHLEPSAEMLKRSDPKSASIDILQVAMIIFPFTMIFHTFALSEGGGSSSKLVVLVPYSKCIETSAIENSPKICHCPGMLASTDIFVRSPEEPNCKAILSSCICSNISGKSVGKTSDPAKASTTFLTGKIGKGE